MYRQSDYKIVTDCTVQQNSETEKYAQYH